MKSLKTRFFVILFSLLFAVYLLIPTILKFGWGISVPRTTKPSDPWYFSLIPSEVLKLGLDLRGGLHLVLGLDFEEVERDAILKLKNQLSEISKDNKLEKLTFEVTKENTINITYPDDATWKKLDSLIGKYYGPDIDFVSQTEKTAVIKMSSLYHDRVKDQAVEQAAETLRNRIDEFGIAEPIITKQGKEKILVQFPGLRETETSRIKEIISRTAKLSFQIVRTGPEEPKGYSRENEKVPSYEELKDWVLEFETKFNKKPNPNEPISLYLRELNAFLAEKLPKGTEVLMQKKLNVNTREAEYIPYLLDREPIVTGEELQDARQGWDSQTNLPEVDFTLTPAGSVKFEEGTGANVGRFMAIVLDSNVTSAPRIKQKIGGGRARIELGGSGRSLQEIQNDAKDTALVLRSGALPAKLLFLEEKNIGPSLGAEAIRTGMISMAIGLVVVIIFMIFYYKLSGIVASLALTLNGLFIFAILAAFEGTLTLPGLAGIALTVGMAVDANVLIFERMREELKFGKSPNMSVAEGFSKALSAIIDGNLTTLIAAVILFQFGYGPIKGFSVTLIIGLLTSMYTAVFISKFVFDYFVVSKHKKTLSV